MTASPEDFILAMRRFPAGVTVVTSGEPGTRSGFTATSVTSVAAEPPCLLVCANRLIEARQTIERTGHFAVNILAEAQWPLAEAFAGRAGAEGEARFLAGEWRALASGAPVLVGACAAFDCRIERIVEVATHSVVVGTVIAVTATAGVRPLAYLDRCYVGVDPVAASLQPLGAEDDL